MFGNARSKARLERKSGMNCRDVVSRAGTAQGAAKTDDRRGVATVLAMMFLVLFGSLAAAMAVSSKGNLRTAATHLHVMRALGAAETGLKIGESRLAAATNRFIVSNSNMTGSFVSNVWNGSIPNGESYTVSTPPYGAMESPTPAGIARALANQFAQDGNVQTGVSVDTPTIAGAMAGVDTTNVYSATGWLYTPAIGLNSAVGTQKPQAYSIIFAPLKNGTDIRIIATGYDFDYSRTGAPITRTVMQDYRIGKRVKQAIISPSKLQIGKNVLVTGDLGARYTDVTQNAGDPLQLRSDFFGLNATLNTKLTDFFTALRTYDIDGDNRLRVAHPTEGAAIPPNTRDYDGDGRPDAAFADVTGDGYVDEFDIFINHFDINRDGKVALAANLSAGTPNAGLSPEFVDNLNRSVDEDLAILIDTNNPDRNRNGVWGFVDTNRNGKWDAGEPFNDYDSARSVNRDQILGYRDGVIDKRDQYGKVRGRLIFKTTSAAWTAGQGDYSSKVQGPIRPTDDSAARTFDAPDQMLPNIDSSTFVSSEAALKTAADGSAFTAQVATNLGVSASSLPTYVETRPSNTTLPRYLRLDPDNNLDGLPDNSATAYFEKMPYNAPTFSDWYYRPVYENMTFRDVKIPMGTNALFKNCQFIGVTYVETTSTNSHVLWNEYGKLQVPTGQTRPSPVNARIIYGDNSGETSYPTMLPASALPPNQYVLMSQAKPLDKADIPANQTGSITNFSQLPNPLVLGGKRVTDTRTVSNNIRFHDCLFVGSVVSDKPGVFTQIRNKLTFTGSTRFKQTHPDYPNDPLYNPQDADRTEIAKSSLMLPNYSVDIGTFNSPPSQDVQLRGAVVAGVLDMRGNVNLDGALMLTFKPQRGTAPMIDVLGNPIGNTANFNTTIGYFGPSDGDSESLDPATLPTVGGVKIVGYDTDGDGLADVGPTGTPPSGAVAVPFYGYGRITLRFDPTMTLPSGIMLPMYAEPVTGSYREGKP